MAGVCPYGVQLASSGMNFSALPAASMWADTCPIDAQQFQGSANETLPSQTNDPLADLIHDVGLGLSNSSHIVVDIKAFMKSLGDRPFYSRSMLRHAAEQLNRARNGLNITLTDCYGATRVYPAEDISFYSQYFSLDFFLDYNGLHLLATPPPGYHFSLDDMLPIYVAIDKKVEETTDLRYGIRLRSWMQEAEKHWQTTHPRHVLFNSLNRLKHTAQITNIVCIGLGTLQVPHQGEPAGQYSISLPLLSPKL